MSAPFLVSLTDPLAADADLVGPKAANLATLAAAGLPTPGGLCIMAAAYRHQVTHLGLAATIRDFAAGDVALQRRIAVEVRLKLYQGEVAPALIGPLRAAWRDQPKPVAVRSSALIEDRADASFAGQFESFLGLHDESEFFIALRACWAALWTTRARAAMVQRGLSPADTAMAVLVQPVINATASGGGLSETADRHMLISATWGLGSAIAQGEVVPDRIVLTRAGFVRTIQSGRKDHRETCSAHRGVSSVAVPNDLAATPCLDAVQATTLARLMRKAESVLGMPVEIEWALDEVGFRLLQARRLRVAPAAVPDDIWLKHPGLSGHPAGLGWGSGRAVVVNCECELSRVGPGDILVTRVAGPSLSHILPRVGGVVAEMGGSTSHLASLARERGIPMVLGVIDATRHIPDGAQVAVDGVAGIVRWIA
jgi:pyruvate, water dikinase